MQKYCTWDPRDEPAIRRIFMSRGSHRLSDMLRDARIRGRPDWIPPTVWEELQTYWRGERFTTISSQNKGNRRSEKGGSLHTGGSIPPHEHAMRMVSSIPLHKFYYYLIIFHNHNIFLMYCRKKRPGRFLIFLSFLSILILGRKMVRRSGWISDRRRLM